MESNVRLYFNRVWKIIRIAGIIFIIIFHLMYFISRKTPHSPDSSDVFENLNYQSKVTIRDNIRKNSGELGYVKFCWMIPLIGTVAIGFIGGFSVFDKEEKQKRANNMNNNLQ